MEAELIGYSQRLLILDGYIFRRHRVGVQRINWRCSRNRKNKCTASVSTSCISKTDGKVALLKSYFQRQNMFNHNHPPCPEEVEFERRQAVKTQLQRVDEPTDNGECTDSQNTELLGDPTRYLSFSMKSERNPSFDYAESIVQESQSTSNLSRSPKTASLRNDQFEFTDDLDVSPNNIVTRPDTAASLAVVPCLSLVSSSETEESIMPKISEDVDKMEPNRQHYTSIKKKKQKKEKMRNDRIMELLSSSVETISKTVQCLTELSSMKKYKKSKKKKRLEEEEDDCEDVNHNQRESNHVIIETIPSLPNALPVMNAPLLATLLGLPADSEAKEDSPVDDMIRDDMNVKMSDMINVGQSKSNPTFETTNSRLSNFVSNEVVSTTPEHSIPINDQQVVPHYKLFTERYMSEHRYPAPTLDQSCFYQPSLPLRSPFFGTHCQYRCWNSNIDNYRQNYNDINSCKYT